MPPPRKRLRDSSGRFTPTKRSPPIPSLPPTAQALGIPEILEKILINLDPKTLLLSNRVCTSWHALLVTSIRLRRALFLDPVACGDVSYLDWRLDDRGWYDHDIARLNLGEHVRGPARDQKPILYETHWGKARDDKGRYQVFVNPLLKEMFPFLSTNGLYWHETPESLTKEAQRPEASWRQMFFTQPPINFLAVERDTKDEEDDEMPMADWTLSPVKKQRDSKGLTIEELFYALATIGRGSWIEGRAMWKDYEGAHDLEGVEVDDG